MKICAYVQEAYAKANYKNECMDTRQFVGLRVIMDALSRAGYDVEWAGSATVHEYDVVLVSLTADCDWWPWITERLRWHRGNYKVVVGGAGVLHITPFLPFADYFCLGRGEDSIVNLIRRLDGKDGIEDDSVIESATFSPDRTYHIRQADFVYPHKIPMERGKGFQEDAIGCNHRCLFCAYTWQRRFISNKTYYAMGTGLFNMEDRERAMLDLVKDRDSIDFRHLRSTAIGGMSERLRYMVNKRISREMMRTFIVTMLDSRKAGILPHQIKFFNIVGYPTETEDDWMEFLDTISEADLSVDSGDKQWSIVLNATPFRPMPATPLACAPMSKRDYRGKLGATLGKGLRGNLIYQGRSLWCVEGMGTDSLPTVELSAIVHRGGEADTESIARLCRTAAFWRANSATRAATLERYFNMDYLFGAFDSRTLPSRYLRTWCAVERCWDRPPWLAPYAITPDTDSREAVRRG